MGVDENDVIAGGEQRISLYAKHQKVYPRHVSGQFAYLRITAVGVLLGLFYLLPWLRWDGRPAVLFDLPARKFYLFGMTMWPQDFVYLAALLIIAGMSLFFFTALAGRLWCGFACPQTVWTSTFLWLEHLFEGDRLQKMKLDQSPMSWRKFRIKAMKHTTWVVYSLFTGLTFVAYFTPIGTLLSNTLSFSLGPWETFWVLFYGAATYGNAGWLREQVCLYMCPYARFQSAMFDDDTLIIAYDEKRGEPRGSRRRGSDSRAAGLGDCIDCKICVQVCPTGIDIRKGLQYECIGCAACIDACDDVMEQMGYAPGLVRYTNHNAIHGKKSRIVRPRILIYGALLCAAIGLLTWSIATRVPVEIDVVRDRNQLYRETNEGRIENVYTISILNMDEQPHAFRITTSGMAGVDILTEQNPVPVDAGAVRKVVVRLSAAPESIPARKTMVTFHVESTATAALADDEESRFIGPERR